MRDRRARVAGCLVAVVLGAGLVAGCGGDDDEPAAATTVTEQVTVTDATPVTPTTEAVPDVIPGGVPDGGDAGGDGAGVRPSDEDLDAAVAAYVQLFGISETQARCLVDKSLELAGGLEGSDPSAILASGGLQILEDCGIDPLELASQFGGTP